jgi:hypothetical protein
MWRGFQNCAMTSSLRRIDQRSNIALAHAQNSAFVDSCQLIRKETKMEVVHLNQKQLAARWHLSEACPERWRSEGIGPKFMRLKGRVLCRQVDIDAYEESCLATSTKTSTAQA